LGVPTSSAISTGTVVDVSRLFASVNSLAESTEDVSVGRFHWIWLVMLLAAFIAVQVSLATTPTALVRLTSVALATEVGIFLTVPPKTGACTTVANIIPGTLTSMPKTADPSTLDGMSSRACVLPMNLVVVPSVAVVGGVIVAATSSSSANVCDVLPLVTVPPEPSFQVPPYFWLAACNRVSRTMAAAVRIGRYHPIMLVDPPVTCAPKIGLP
jgi:hypothetical protein